MGLSDPGTLPTISTNGKPLPQWSAPRNAIFT